MDGLANLEQPPCRPEVAQLAANRSHTPRSENQGAAPAPSCTVCFAGGHGWTLGRNACIQRVAHSTIKSVKDRGTFDNPRQKYSGKGGAGGGGFGLGMAAFRTYCRPQNTQRNTKQTPTFHHTSYPASAVSPRIY